MPNNTPVTSELLAGLQSASISRLATMISVNWKPVNFAARPYLDAMASLETLADKYGADDGKSIVAYFLNNAATWRGDVAKVIKAELKRRLAAAGWR